MVFSLMCSDLATDNSISREAGSRLLALTVFHLYPPSGLFLAFLHQKANTNKPEP